MCVFKVRTCWGPKWYPPLPRGPKWYPPDLRGPKWYPPPLRGPKWTDPVSTYWCIGEALQGLVLNGGTFNSIDTFMAVF